MVAVTLMSVLTLQNAIIKQTHQHDEAAEATVQLRGIHVNYEAHPHLSFDRHLFGPDSVIFR